MFRITQITRTCLVSPSQWEGKTQDGDNVRVHYRWGVLTVQVGSKVVFSKTVGKPATEQDDEIFFTNMRLQGWADKVLAKIKTATIESRKTAPVCFDGLISYKDVKKYTADVCEFPDFETTPFNCTKINGQTIKTAGGC